MQITIVGAGYVGLVTGVCLSHRGRDITVFDIDEQKIQALRNGATPIYENQLPELLAACGNRLCFTTDAAQAFAKADVVLLAVPTPDRRDGSANLTYLYSACKQLAAHCQNGCLVLVKSTVPVGTCDKLERFFASLTTPGLFRVASNPEFLAQGTAVRDTLYPARIVIGAADNRSAEQVREIYRGFDCEFVVTDRRSAEMIKYASNDFLALKISYINEIANLCELVGADAETVALGMRLDPRIGQHYLRPGTGYGGSCFPKDTKALHWLARYHDYELKTIKATIEVNENQKVRLFKKAKKYYKSFQNLTVAVLGLAFKPGTDDLREAPALEVIGLLTEEGARVRVWDPAAVHRFRLQFPNLATDCATIEETLHGVDMCLILTEWDEIKAFAPRHFQRCMKTPIVIDGRNCFAPEAFYNTGVVYDSVGRRTVNEEIVKRLEFYEVEHA